MDEPRDGSVGFLLSQVGFASARRFAGRLAALELEPRQFALLGFVAAAGGQPQHALGEALSVPPSSMVSLVDHLEARGLLERRAIPDDRRARALYVTDAGRDLLARAGKVGLAYEEELSSVLGAGERDQLIAVLRRIARLLGLQPGVHPGMAGTGPAGPCAEE